MAEFIPGSPKPKIAMDQWGNSNLNSISTIGKQEWSPERSKKAMAALEAIGSFIPGLGQAIAAKDYAKAIDQNDSVSGVLAAAQFMPALGGIAKLGSAAYKPSAYALKMMRRGSVAEQGMEKAIKSD